MHRKLEHSDRLLNLLDKAYDASFQPDSFHDLMKAAHDFYFSEPDDFSAHALAVSDYENNASISSHLARIERLLDERELENRSHSSNINRPALIALLIDPETGIVEGNVLAKGFFGHGFPIHMNKLNLDASSRRKLLDLAREAVAAEGFNNEICLIKRKDETAAHLAKYGKWINAEFTNGAWARGLAVSIAHFEWTAEALQFCQSMFDLSVSETEVLAALLNGQSQAEIARSRRRSVETIKAQSKAILRKSGCSRTTDLLVLATTYGLLVDPGKQQSRSSRAEVLAISRPDRIFTRADGRKISYGVYGDPGGKPVLFIHGLVQGPFFPADMIGKFKEDGIRVIAPSRPSFGQTDPPHDWKAFDQTVVDDVIQLLPEITNDPLTVIAHQGGTSHACRIAFALGKQTRNMVMVGAGIPIDEKKHISHMGVQTRVAALGVKYTPRILETLIHIGIVNWLRKGIRPYAEHLFSNSPTDQALLDDPRIYTICEAGILHMIEQGAKAIIYDGKAAMADWESDFLKLTCPIKWLHGTKDPIMRYDFVQEFVVTHGGAPVELVDNAGNTMHISHSDIFHRVIAQAVTS
jgi:pimeloyl-ACP methyl ester carboxylesterase/DNA-binding CsgD family transcriptional regulator